mgnify:CR=1 FL=1
MSFFYRNPLFNSLPPDLIGPLIGPISVPHCYKYDLGYLFSAYTEVNAKDPSRGDELSKEELLYFSQLHGKYLFKICFDD